MADTFEIAGMPGRYYLTHITQPLNRRLCDLSIDEVTALVATGLFSYPAGCFPLTETPVLASQILYFGMAGGVPSLILDLPATRWRPDGFLAVVPESYRAAMVKNGRRLRVADLSAEDRMALMLRHGVGDRLGSYEPARMEWWS